MSPKSIRVFHLKTTSREFLYVEKALVDAAASLVCDDINFSTDGWGLNFRNFNS